jgi:hypothetical protein
MGLVLNSTPAETILSPCPTAQLPFSPEEGLPHRSSEAEQHGTTWQFGA